MSETKKGCELCGNPARMFCDSDQASLCWDCDGKVHAANFLVAKHSRTLLCHVCQSTTPWTATGANLGRTVSVCHACAHRGISPPQEDSYDSQESESIRDEEYYSDESDESSEEEDEEDGENQVVPWSESASDTAPPPRAAEAASSSSSEENVSLSSSKRIRENYHSESEDDDGGCSSPEQEADESCGRSDNLRPLKTRRRTGGGVEIPAAEERFSGTAAIVEKLRRFDSEAASAMILGLCKLTRD